MEQEIISVKFGTKERADTNDYVIYLHRNPVTNDVFYVGMGALRRAYIFGGRSPRWTAYVNKYGKPIVEIYKSHLFEYEAFQLERTLIKTFGRRGIDNGGVLVNLSLGGEYGIRGVKFSQEVKDKLSRAHKGKKLTPEHKEHIRQAFLGEKHPRWRVSPSKEAREKMRLAKLGKVSPIAKKVINIHTGEIYPSGAAAARAAGKCETSFVAALKRNCGMARKLGYKLL
jgi:hypothetical protein